MRPPARSRFFWICLFGFFLRPFLFSQNPALRIEPPSWWTGMKNPVVQLMVHGDDIAGLKPSIAYPGVSIRKVFKTENPNYLFLDLVIEKTTKPGSLKINVGNNFYGELPLLAREKGSSLRTGFGPSDAIYLITPDRFANGDPSNDASALTLEKPNRNDKDGRHGGDIQGIAQHLEYIRDLGFTTIWSTPLVENNQPNTSYHGYAITDFYKIDPRFGTNESYRDLSRQARAMGMGLILDVVLNHCGDHHWWMKDLPSSDWINFDGKYVNTNHRRETHQDPHRSKADEELMTAGWFVPTMPDLNQKNPFLATYLIQNTIWWIEYAGLDGLRVDTYPYSDKVFSSKWSKAILSEYPGFNMVGEEWSMNPMIIAYWQKDKKNPDGYISHMPSMMDFPLNQALVQALNENESFNEGWIRLYHSLANDFTYADPGRLLIFPDNHDMSRFYTQIHEDFARWKLGLVFMTTTRGIPQIYYGTEVLLTNPYSDAHGEIRSDFPGGWAGDPKNAFTGTGLTEKEKEAQGFLKSLLLLRKNTPALQSGKLIHFAPEQGVYVYFRILGNEKYMIILGKNKNSIQMDFGRFKEIFGENPSFMDAFTGQALAADKARQLDAYGYRVIKVK